MSKDYTDSIDGISSELCSIGTEVSNLRSELLEQAKLDYQLRVKQTEYMSRIADALELAILPQNNVAYADKVKETLNVDDATQELAPEVKTEQVETDQNKKEYTHDELKKLCLAKSREDLANKPKLKALLKEFGAVKASDVPNDKLEEIITKIESGEF